LTARHSLPQLLARPVVTLITPAESCGLPASWQHRAVQPILSILQRRAALLGGFPPAIPAKFHAGSGYGGCGGEFSVYLKRPIHETD